MTIACVASYPSFRDAATENEDNDMELELRSLLNQLDDENMERALVSDEESDDEDDSYEVSKRQGGRNVIDKQSECEIKCIHAERNPVDKKTKPKTVGGAAKVCRQKCNLPGKKRGQKKTIVQRTRQPVNQKLSLREFTEDESNDSNEEQELQRREFYDYLLEQLQQNDEE